MFDETTKEGQYAIAWDLARQDSRPWRSFDEANDHDSDVLKVALEAGAGRD